MSSRGSNNRWVWFAVVLLAVLHHDFWWWNDRSVVFAGLPIGLAYHALYSLAAAAVWFLAVKFAWPEHIEEWADAGESQTGATAAKERGDRPGTGRSGRS